ncbi:MAG: alkaline phosphatase family protein, partial [Thermoplasmata archaeon]
THVVPIANLIQDYPYNATPPAFTYIVPNLDNDAHNTNAKVGDDFLKGFVSKLVNQSWFSSTAIFITYDESGSPRLDTGYDGLAGGPVPMFAVSPYSVGIGAVDHTDTSHYNLLSTMEWLLGLPPTGTGNDGTAAFPPMKGLFNFEKVSPEQYNVTFSETGLPTGTEWSATLDGTLESSRTPSVGFTEPNGSYGYSVLSPTPTVDGTRYVATPSSGSAEVSGANVTVTISYAPEYSLTAVASPVGDGTVSPESGWYSSGQKVSIQATPGSGDAFSNWSGQGLGSYSGPSNPVELTVRGPINETAEFTAASGSQVTVTFTESGLPSGTEWNVSLNGQWESSTNTTVTFPVSAGSYGYTIGSPVTGTNASTRYVTTPADGLVVVGNEPVGESVPYQVEYNLSVSQTPTGAGVVTPLGGWYPANSSVTLSAEALGGDHFALWVGSGAGNYTGPQESPQLTIEGPVSEVAEFVKPSVVATLSLVISGLPPGTNWSANVAGGSWTTNQTTITIPLSTGAVGYAIESPIPVSPSLEYVAQENSGTVNLTGGPVGVSVSFVPETFLEIRAQGVGDVTETPSGSGWYAFGSSVEFAATVPAGSVFAGWNGTGAGSYSGMANPMSINVTGPITEVADFEPTAPGSTGGGGGAGGINIAPSWLVPVGLLAGVVGSVVAIRATVRRSRRAKAQRPKK